jgi:Ni,Fe-hydrogenase III small subunit
MVPPYLFGPAVVLAMAALGGEPEIVGGSVRVLVAGAPPIVPVWAKVPGPPPAKKLPAAFLRSAYE